MKYSKRLSNKCRRGRTSPLIPTALEAGNFESEVRRLGTLIPPETSTFRFHAQFAMRLLADGLAEEHRWVPNSGWITFTSAPKGTSSMPGGCCGFRI